MINFDTLASAMTLPVEKPSEPAINPHSDDASEYMPTSEDLPHDEERDGKSVILPAIVDSATFVETDIPEPLSLIAGLIHQGTKVIVGGGSKSFKTWIQLDAAICVAYGRPWMGFETNPGRVLFVNFEIQPAFFQRRLKTIMEAKGIAFETGRLDVWNLRGHSAAYGILIPQIIQRIKEVGYVLIILDPIYKLYGSANENDASEVAQLLNSLEKVCVDTGAAVMFGAHYSKGNQSAKESIDRISGSGVFARDPDSIIPFTRHKEEGSFVIEPTLRNLPPIEPFVVTWNFPMMERDPALDPAELKQITGRPKSCQPKDLFDLLPDTGLMCKNWEEIACQNLRISPSTFSRLKRELLTKGVIILSRIDDKWKPVRKH